MNPALSRLQSALAYAQQVRPRIGGFPHLAEVLRRAGVRDYRFDVVSTTAIYVFDDGVVVQPGQLLETTDFEVADFNKDALVAAIRADQNGESSFADFCAATLRSGVLSFRIDLNQRTCTYHGSRGQTYTEHYPPVTLPAH